MAARRTTSSFGCWTGTLFERSPAVMVRAEATTLSTGESAVRASRYAPPAD